MGLEPVGDGVKISDVLRRCGCGMVSVAKCLAATDPHLLEVLCVDIPVAFLLVMSTMLALSSTTLVLLAPLLLLVHVLVRYVLNPLRRIPPAHPLGHFTSLWIQSVRWRSIENATLKAAHDRLGSIVCLGPNEISVNCIKGGIRDVYAGGFEKANAKDGYNWYAFFTNYGG
jgi:hypothetical protein